MKILFSALVTLLGSLLHAGEQDLFFSLGKQVRAYNVDESDAQSRFFYELVQFINLTQKNQNKQPDSVVTPREAKELKIVYFKHFNPLTPIEDLGMTWGKCAQDKKAFYLFYQPKGVELRGFVSLKSEGTVDVSGVMMTGNIQPSKNSPKLFMDISMTTKDIATLDKSKVETSLKIKY